MGDHEHSAGCAGQCDDLQCHGDSRANDLNVYYYIRHLLSELSRHFAARRTLREDELETLMPWSKTLPEECYKKRRE